MGHYNPGWEKRRGLMEDDCAIRAILFDSDNTLYNYKGAQSAACEAVIDYLGAGDPVNLNSYFLLNPAHCENHRIIQYYLNDIGIADGKKLKNACAIYTSKKLEKIILFEGVYETIVRLRERKLLLGIVTNSQSRDVCTYLEKNGIKDFFQCIVSPEESKTKKPAPGPFEMALSLLTVTSKNSLMVGDTIITDLIPAKKLGMKTILFCPEWNNDPLVRPESRDIDYSVNNFRGILDILDIISQ